MLDFFSSLNVDLFFFLKILFLVVLGGFSIFTVVLFNQVRVMNGVVKHAIVSSIVAFFATLLLIAAISLFVLALVIL